MTTSAQTHADLGWQAVLADDDAAAEAHFRAALALAPNDPEVLTGLAQVFRRQGQLRDAVLLCDAAIRANPGYAHAWLERGFVLASGGSMQLARDCYTRVIELEPGNAPAHAGLASILARDGDSAAGRTHANTALAADPGNVIATGALATMELEAGHAKAARDLVVPVHASLTAPSQDRIMLASRLGDACAKLGEADAAHAAYSASKADFAELFAPRFPSRAPNRAFIEGISAALGKHTFTPAAEPVPVSLAAAAHVFLLGHPRSGTTMVENVLASLTNVAALEERPTLGDADVEFLGAPDGLARFAALGDAALPPYRAAYWQRVAQAGTTAPGQCFVDMDPLKATRLPLIARLFPQAKVLVMRRDPRDVVWSCFKTNFALTNAALDFTTLEGTARHYAAMMDLIELAQARLALAFHPVRYEALVRDFDTETQAMCSFAGLEWSEDLRRFDKTAQRRGVATASAGQVRRGLYDGSGQWQPYAKFMEPVLPILAPWIAKFGYA
jgi:tetratricopeptide (TPR) repeat protein